VPTEIQGEFPGEVSATGSTLDFDVKGKAIPSTKPKP
jgi:hypothetical protein